MSPAWKYPVVFTGIAVAWKLSLYAAGAHRGAADTVGVFLTVLLLLLAIFFTIRKTRRETPDNLNRVFRTGIKGGIVFTLFYCGFLLVYYLYIDPAYFPDKLSAGMDHLAQTGATHEQLTEFYKNGKLRVLNPYSHTTLSFFGLMFLSLLYSAVITFLFRRKQAG